MQLMISLSRELGRDSFVSGIEFYAVGMQNECKDERAICQYSRGFSAP